MENKQKGETLQTTEAVGLTETAQIQTQTSTTRGFFRGSSGWEDCEHKSWEELKEDGWKFEYLSIGGYVVMTRNGYINHFRNNPKRGAN